MDLRQALQKNFSYQDFQGEQERILETVMNQQKDLLALMPTGAGKSLCFQFPAKLRDGLVLVVSPLIALMRDQAQAAQKLGLKAECLNALQSSEEKKRVYDSLKKQNLQLILVTPERFRKPEFWDALGSQKIQLFAVDEAHCISQWGHDFRPDYSRLGEIRSRLGGPQTLALTATATPEVQKDICESLGIDSGNTILGGIERDNLEVNVIERMGASEKIEFTIEQLRQTQAAGPGSQIVYFSLIKTLREAEAHLQRAKLKVLVYHGDLPAEKRKFQQRQFLEQDNPIMLATPAFGLGIDKKNVRNVMHFELPGSLEDYYQEIGRGGRDGLRCKTFLLYDQDDILIQMDFMKWAHPEKQYVEKLAQLIRDNAQQFAQEGADFLRERLSFKNRSDYRVESSLSILERWGCLEKNGESYVFERLPSAEDWQRDPLAKRHQHQQKKLLNFVEWIKMESGCRLARIYEYFGETETQSCGICDLCRGEKR